MRVTSRKNCKKIICLVLACAMILASFGYIQASETGEATEGTVSAETGDSGQNLIEGGSENSDEGGADEDESGLPDAESDNGPTSDASVQNEELLSDPAVDLDPTVSQEELDTLREYRPSASDPLVRKLSGKTKKPKGKLTKKNGHIVYFCSNGKLLKDKWIKIKNAVYCFDKKGYARKGSYTYKGFHYYFDGNGRLQWNYLRKSGSKLYYYGPTGAMVRSAWITIKGERYYFLSNGTMAKKRWIGNSYVDASGRISRGDGSERVNTGWFRAANKKQRLIIIGYSRVAHISEAVTTDGNVIYIAKKGAHLSWVNKTAVPRLKSYLKKYPNSKVVFVCGYNDVASHSAASAFKKFKKMFSPLIRKYKKASFYVVDILPNEYKNGKIGKRILTFNRALKQAFPKQSIGGYDYLVENGYENSFDSIHYSGNTSRTIFNYILKKVK